MIRRAFVATVVGVLASAQFALAQPSLPATFKSRTVASPDGADIFVRWGGAGPVVVLLHGYAETSDSWGPLAAELVKTHTVVVPDLRGIGRSSRPHGGYDKRTQAADLRAVITALGHDRAAVVSHDIGIMVAYAYAARYPEAVERLVVMDAPLPGIAPWSEIVRNPLLWHFSFRGPDAERLVQGRERIYLDRIWNDFAGDPGKVDEATRRFYATQYALPGTMRAGFAHFAAFSRDAEDNREFQRTKLTMPVLAVGGERSFGAVMAVVMRNVANNVREAVVPGAGHWLMEESPAFTVALVRGFLEDRAAAAAPPVSQSDERRITPPEFDFPSPAGAATGTSGISGIRTVVLKGDPERDGLYTIMLHVPPNTRIAAHDHADDRVATVVSGTWYFGYGERFAAADLKALPPGSFYTESSNRPHFAETRKDPVIVQITGIGPSSTRYVDPAADPRRTSDGATGSIDSSKEPGR
jgi:pimeloyl-ACP methyl ester carboxylesterase